MNSTTRDDRNDPKQRRHPYIHLPPSPPLISPPPTNEFWREPSGGAYDTKSKRFAPHGTRLRHEVGSGILLATPYQTSLLIAAVKAPIFDLDDVSCPLPFLFPSRRPESPQCVDGDDVLPATTPALHPHGWSGAWLVLLGPLLPLPPITPPCLRGLMASTSDARQTGSRARPTGRTSRSSVAVAILRPRLVPSPPLRRPP